MKFKSHQRRLEKQVDQALEQAKVAALSEHFLRVLVNAKSLLKVDSFDFWIQQLTNTPAAELPVTHHGLSYARNYWETDLSRKDLERYLLQMVIYLFSYWDNDDEDAVSFDLHDFYYEPEQVLFKTSPLVQKVVRIGDEPKSGPVKARYYNDRRIAYRNELDVPAYYFIDGPSNHKNKPTKGSIVINKSIPEKQTKTWWRFW